MALRAQLRPCGLLVSVLVQYLNANDAGPGFYDLATRKRLLRPRPPRDEKLIFWVQHVKPSAHTPGGSVTRWCRAGQPVLRLGRGPEQGPAWVSTLRGKPMARIPVTPVWAGILDFKTRFPSALTV